MSEAHAQTLAERQRRLLALLKMRETAEAQVDPRLKEVALSRGLKALQEIDYFWKEYSIVSRCPFTAGLMRTEGVLREAVTGLIREERVSPFIEEMACQFLERASNNANPLIATVARFERALTATAEGDPAEHRIEWEQDPYYVLSSLLNHQTIDPTASRGHFVTVVSAQFEERFRVAERRLRDRGDQIREGQSASVDPSGNADS